MWAGEFDTYQFKKPFYSTTTYNNEVGNWTNSNFDNTELGLDLAPFMEYTDYMAATEIND